MANTKVRSTRKNFSSIKRVIDYPDLILMDVVMPDLNGFQATRKISKDERTAHIPIIIVTTKKLETDRVWGLRQGAKEYLVKPVTDKALKKVLEAHLP